MNLLEMIPAMGKAAAAVLIVLASSGVGWFVTRLSVAIALRRFRRAEGRTWVERAAAADPARRAYAARALLASSCLGAVVFFRVAPGLDLPSGPVAVLSGLAALVGGLAVGQGLESRLCRARVSPRGPLAGPAFASGMAPAGLAPAP
jgi:hypothetical protein